MLEDNIKGVICLAGIYATIYSVIGIIGLLSLFFDPFLFGIIVKDPIES